MQHTVMKFKRVDNGKMWIAGHVKEGKYGAQVGMKMTEELKAYLDSIAIGQWVNFSFYKPYEEKSKEQEASQSDDTEVPF